MEPMDLACIVAESEEISNVQISFSRLKGINSKMQIYSSFHRVAAIFPKFQQKIVCIFGDLYWQKVQNFDIRDYIIFLDGLNSL
jgi:hypothetical protein